MLNAQAALDSAQVAGYRGAFRPTDGQKNPPDTYCVYLYTRRPETDWDDKTRDEVVKAFLHLYSRDDPEEAMAAIRTAMQAEGFALIRETEDYVDGAEDYETLSEWEGTLYGHEI